MVSLVYANTKVIDAVPTKQCGNLEKGNLAHLPSFLKSSLVIPEMCWDCEYPIGGSLPSIRR